MAELITPGSGGNHYIPYEERTGKESVVYFTRDLSAEGLKKIFERVNSPLIGKVVLMIIWRSIKIKILIKIVKEEIAMTYFKITRSKTVRISTE